MEEEDDLKPLGFKCRDADCANDLHCYLQSRKKQSDHQAGQCIYCGTELVDWGRVYKRDIADAAHTFAMLRTEFFRHHYWHREIDLRAVNYARRKGLIGMQLATEKRIRQSVGAEQPFHDGFQTPYEGNPIYYAQHATATCCRTCIEVWHDIPKERALTDDEVKYLSALAMLYIRERLPFLTQLGEKVPPVRNPPKEKMERTEHKNDD